MNVNNVVTVGVSLVGVLTLSVTGWACDFFFNYEEITAPIGTVGQIGVQAEKTHNRCVMDEMDYYFEYSNLQVLGETEWKQTGPNLYEKWFQVSLSRVGNGEFKIYKDCTKDEYEEAVLPITVIVEEEDNVWGAALSGVYPFADETDLLTDLTIGTISVDNGALYVGDKKALLADVPAEFADYSGEVYMYIAQAEGKSIILLLASDQFFYRFDHLLDSVSTH